MAINIQQELERMYGQGQQQATSLSDRLNKIDQYNSSVTPQIRQDTLDFSNRPAGYNPINDFGAAIETSERARTTRSNANEDLTAVISRNMALLEKLATEQNRKGSGGAGDGTDALAKILGGGAATNPVNPMTQPTTQPVAQPTQQAAPAVTPPQAPQAAQQPASDPLTGWLKSALEQTTRPFRKLVDTRLATGENAIEQAKQFISDPTKIDPTKIMGILGNIGTGFYSQGVNDSSRTSPVMTADETKKYGEAPVRENLKDLATIGSVFPASFGAGIVGKSIAPAAVSGGLYAAGEDNANLSSIAAGAAGGAAAGGILGGVGKLLGKTGNVAGGASKKLALKGLKPTPSQQLNFYKDTGTKLDDFIVKNNLQGAGYDQIASVAEALQGQFDEVAQSTAISIPSDKIVNALQAKARLLEKSILPADKTKAAAIKEIAQNFKTNYAKQALPVNTITSLRREVDAGIKSYPTDETVKGPLNILRDVLQDNVRGVADKAGVSINGQSMKEAGGQLSSLYKLMDIAEKQQFTGKSTLPLGLTTMLGGAAGATGGIPGMLAVGGATAVANNPSVMKGASKVLSGVPGAMNGAANSKLMQILSPILNKGAAITGGAAGSSIFKEPNNTGVQNNEQTNTDSGQHITDTTSSTPQVQAPQRKITLDQMQQILFSPDIPASMKTQVKDFYDLQEKAIKEAGTSGATGKKTEAQVARDDARTLAVDALNQLNTNNKIQTGPMAKVQDFLGIVNAGDQSTLDFNNTINNLYAAIAKSRAGSAMTPNEEKRLKTYIPSPGDSSQQLKTKLKGLVEFFGSTSPDVGLPDAAAILQSNAGSSAQILAAVPAKGKQAAQENLPLIASALKAEGIDDPQTLAYAMATIEHETAGTFQPIEEYGGRQQATKLGYGGGQEYFGRGFIQLTHKDNYATIGQRIGMGNQLAENPDLAKDPVIAAKILAAFFKDRGVSTATQKGDFIAARKPVNGTDQASTIATRAKAYLRALG